VVVAMINVSFVVFLKSLNQVGTSLLRINSMSDILTIKLERDPSITLNAKNLVKQIKPQQQSVVARK
jgi:hypothetical protein